MEHWKKYFEACTSQRTQGERRPTPAEAVVIHLQKYLEVKLGIDPETGVTQPTNVMFGTLLPYTNVLPGVGGGIVGPTTTFPTPLQITGGTLLVPPGNVH